MDEVAKNVACAVAVVGLLVLTEVVSIKLRRYKNELLEEEYERRARKRAAERERFDKWFDDFRFRRVIIVR